MAIVTKTDDKTASLLVRSDQYNVPSHNNSYDNTEKM